MSKASIQKETDVYEFLFALSRVVAHASELKPAFDEITHLLRPIIHFDYLLIHQVENEDQCQIIYAKSTRLEGTLEAQLEWEQILANLVFTTNQIILQQPNPDDVDLSHDSPHFLGIPLVCDKNNIGTLVYIRSGGPVFSSFDINTAQFIAQQIALLINRKMLQLEHETFENQRRQARLQEDFISNITHELRNPLGCIKGYSTTLLRCDIEWDKSTQQQFLQIIDQETDRLSEMIDNLLDSARLQSGQFDMQFQLLRIDTLIKDVVDHTRLQNDNINIFLEMTTPLSPILGDCRRIIQVIENLISNAVKHAPDSDIWIRIKQDKIGIYISVEDHGPGIPEQYIQKVFDRFFRVPEQSPNIHGSGLGLFICKQIIRGHRGKISVTSKVGQGTTFYIFLPYKP